MDVIKKLNCLRLERNMSVYRLSELTGINQSTLANTFSRGTIPSIANIEIICNTLGITLAQFFADEEENVLMTKDEIMVFDKYKKLNPEMRKVVDEVILTFAKIINN